MCEGDTLEAWQASCIRSLLASQNATLELLIIDGEMPTVESGKKTSAPAKKTFLQKLLGKYLLYRLYRKLIFRPLSTRMVDMAPEFNGVARIACSVIRRGKFSQYFRKEDIATISDYKLDFILRFAFGIIRGDVLSAARYGVWSYHHDDEQQYRGGPPCFWEIYRDDDVTGAILQRLTEKLDSGIVLKKGYFSTIKHSYAKNLDAVYFESARWPAQVCARIRSGSLDPSQLVPSATSAPVYLSPTNTQIVASLVKFAWHGVRKLFEECFRHDHWTIGVIEEPIHKLLNAEVTHDISLLPALPRNNFRADPFALEMNDKLQILCEEFDYSDNRGRTRVLAWAHDSVCTEGEIVFKDSIHQSYPFLFTDNGQIYCVPETNQAHEVRLYEAVVFPHEWRLKRILIPDIQAVDSTIIKHNNHWWLFCSLQDQGPGYNLFIWHADNLEGPWLPHHLNPVKTDIHSARPGGTPFVHEGILYRPAQDCAGQYGRLIVFNRVTELSVDDFKEEQAAILDPPRQRPYSEGLHTVASAGAYTIVDVKRRMFIPAAFKHNIIDRLRWLMRP